MYSSNCSLKCKINCNCFLIVSYTKENKNYEEMINLIHLFALEIFNLIHSFLKNTPLCQFSYHANEFI